MPIPSRQAAVYLALTAALIPLAAQARTISDTWPVLSQSRDADCSLEIVGQGKIMVIRASGLAPGQQARLGITNAAMKPIDWTVRADQAGNWSLVYLPFLWSNGDGTARSDSSGGIVGVTLAASQCRMSASAPWTREIRVIP